MKPMEIVWVNKLREILQKDKSSEDKLKEIYLYGVEQEWELGRRWNNQKKNYRH